MIGDLVSWDWQQVDAMVNGAQWRILLATIRVGGANTWYLRFVVLKRNGGLDLSRVTRGF
jgi:hypothetical protein